MFSIRLHLLTWYTWYYDRAEQDEEFKMSCRWIWFFSIGPITITRLRKTGE